MFEWVSGTRHSWHNLAALALLTFCARTAGARAGRCAVRGRRRWCDAGASDSPSVTAEKIGPRTRSRRGGGCGYCTGLELSELNTWLTEETCAGHHAREFIDSAH